MSGGPLSGGPLSGGPLSGGPPGAEPDLLGSGISGSGTSGPVRPASDVPVRPASDVPVRPASDVPVRPASDVVVGADGCPRCPWGLSTPEYVAYHDYEWGRPVRDTVGLFERLTLEAFQSGLSWLTILRKRSAFRAAFAGFDPAAVAAFGSADVDRLLADAGIVRNRRKIEATIVNARAVLTLDHPLEELIWSFQPEPTGRAAPATLADVPAKTPESVALAKGLRAAGFVFVGPTTAYALMQACGLVDDHLSGCWVAGGVG
ncbi:DNA-3-methyladenine glycosylase I [Frankia sp. CcI6]|nr:DNA-3-methyladenine glycosylase I [Frankia sp. CcI6]KFB05688.1 DNA-3-methyladenine glycosylase I [Frankia sp. Allo2]